jgi:hypothetical protein
MLCDKTQKSPPELSERLFLSVGVAGFEPTTPCSQSRCANRTALHPVVPGPETRDWPYISPARLFVSIPDSSGRGNRHDSGMQR